MLIAVLLSILLGAVSYSRVENRYRISQRSSITPLSLFKVISTLLTLSLLLSFFMIRGSNNEYWGLQKKIDRPPSAWELDGNCARMSGYSDPPCMYKIPSATKTVLLIGDSHAAQFSQAIIDASKKAHWNSVIWTMGSCNFALSDKTDILSDACLKKNSSILKWINEYQPNLVVISQYFKIGLPQVEMKSAVIVVKSLVQSVLVVGNTPMFPDERYMVSPALFQNQYDAPKKILISKMNKTDDAASNAFLKEIAIKGIEIASLNSLWCNLEYCNRFSRQGWLFSDLSHLSEFGADLSVPYFTKFLISH